MGLGRLLRDWLLRADGPHILCAPASILSYKQFQELRAALESRPEPEHNRSTCEHCPHCGSRLGEKTSSPSTPPKGGLNYDYVIPGPHPLGCPTYLQNNNTRGARVYKV